MRALPYICTISLGAAAVSPAHGDVLEVGPSGAAWVAGGPVESFATAEAQVPAADPVPTGRAPAAVPEAWHSRVAYLSGKYNVSPVLIEAVIWQESRWNPGALSPVGAQGLAQLMPGTARHLGVDPRDPAANLEGGVRYLRMQLNAFGGDIEKALAAYNAGPGRVQAAGGIPRIRETQNYVASILGRLSAPVRR